MGFGRAITFGQSENGTSQASLAHFGQKTVEDIWDALQITVEERYDPQQILSPEIQQIRSLIEEVGTKVQELVASRHIQSDQINSQETRRVQEMGLKPDELDLQRLNGLRDDCQKDLDVLDQNFS